ncbi:MAG: YggS family pyridoxal phosphate-dependent enzyme [Sediminibacterium sp.]|nr:YggS family pyridoxal phosphate-dependent enzyme [Sediminibacterium sp.]
MAVDIKKYHQLKQHLQEKFVQLVVVTKTQSLTDINTLYELGHRDFGENYVQELISKQQALPADIHWHFIGHLQSNKVKYIAAFIHLIHSVDSLGLLSEINKQAIKNNRVINFLIECKIGTEQTKTGISKEELPTLIAKIPEYGNINWQGFMGMGSFTNDKSITEQEFSQFRDLKNKYATEQANMFSLGMSGDYNIALEYNSNLVRIGSLLFGART